MAAADRRFSPYALRSQNQQQHQRYPLRSISNVCRPVNKPKPAPIRGSMKQVPKLKFSLMEFSLMNDNCILYILERLDLADLCSAAEVSVRLKELAQLAFRIKYGTELNLRLLANGNEKITMKQARSLFYNFGQFIKSLHVSRKQFEFDSPLQRPFLGQQKLFHLISKYCSLDKLTIGHFWFNVELMHETLPIFDQLQSLDFYRITCFCTDEKTFHHFGNVLPMVLDKGGYRLPQIVQLI